VADTPKPKREWYEDPILWFLVAFFGLAFLMSQSKGIGTSTATVAPQSTLSPSERQALDYESKGRSDCAAIVRREDAELTRSTKAEDNAEATAYAKTANVAKSGLSEAEKQIQYEKIGEAESIAKAKSDSQGNIAVLESAHQLKAAGCLDLK
jgi:hypothetical protein